MRARNNKPFLKHYQTEARKGTSALHATRGCQFTCLQEKGSRSCLMPFKSQYLTGPFLTLPHRAWYPAQRTGLLSSLHPEHPISQLLFHTAGAPCRQMGIKVICRSKTANLIKLHLFSVRIYVSGTLMAWPLLSLSPLKLTDL